MHVILGTGVLRLNDQIETKFSDEIIVVGKPLYREAVEKTLERTGADLLLLSDELEGVTEMDELILTIRSRYPKTRIIFIGKELSLEFKSFLYKYNVFDILSERFSEDELRNVFFHPKTWTDVSNDIKSLEGFQRADDLNHKAPDVSNMQKIDRGEYQKIKPIVTGKNSLYQEFIAFWSVLDQSGKTFSAVNTSIFLSSNKDLKVLLLDFNIKNPSIHLQFGFTDGDRNLGAIVEDIEQGRKITSASLDDYLITHPVYPNLKILPGYILPNPDKDAEFYIHVLNIILKAAQAGNFSTILIDMESGLRDELSIHILKNATKVLLHATESPGSLFAIRKMFDAELGPFVPNLLSKKKVFPIVNRAHEDYYNKFKNALETILDGNRTVTAFKEDTLIHTSIFDGSPLLKQPTPHYYSVFFKVANIVHPGLFKPIKQKENGKNNSTNSNLTSLFGKKKK